MMTKVIAFFLEHLYEMMADNYSIDPSADLRHRRQFRNFVSLLASLWPNLQAHSAGRRSAQSRPLQVMVELEMEDDGEGAELRQVTKFERHRQQKQQQQQQQQQQQRQRPQTQITLEAQTLTTATSTTRTATSREDDLAARLAEREQQTNRQIVTFLTCNHIPDLLMESAIEMLFIVVFLLMSWIMIMIFQLHYYEPSAGLPRYQSRWQQSCNTLVVNSMMYCNNKHSFRVAF